MTLKILFIGDPHFKLNNLDIMEEFTNQCLQHITPDIKMCIIAGDILHCHERLHTTVLNKATEFINNVRKKCPVYVLVGNHDYENNQQFLSTRHWMNSLKEWQNTFIIDKTTFVKLNTFSFVMVPYVPPGRFVEALNTIDDDWRKVNCIFAHQEFRGCKMGAITSEVGDEWELSFPLVISGHIHSEQKLQENIFYPGSVIQHAFGESENNGLLLITYSKSDCTMEKMLLKIPKMQTKYIAVEDFEKCARDINPAKNERIKIVCKGTFESFKALQRTKCFKNLILKGVKIQFKLEQLQNNFNHESTVLKSFETILEELIYKEQNTELTKIFNQLLTSS